MGSEIGAFDSVVSRRDRALAGVFGVLLELK